MKIASIYPWNGERGIIRKYLSYC